MKKSFFAVGVVALIFTLATCNQPVSLEPDRPGRPDNLTLVLSDNGNRAIVSWTAGRNAVNHEVVKRMDNRNPIPVVTVAMRQGGLYRWDDSGNLHVWEYGNNTDQWSSVISLFTDWRGDFEIGVRAVPFDYVLGTWTPSDIRWLGRTENFSDFIPVERIDWDESSLPPNAELNLNDIATAYPDDATKKAITWEIRAGDVGPQTLNQRPGAVEWLELPDGIIPYAGTFTVRATVRGGINKGRDDFIDPAHVITVGGTDRYDPIRTLITDTGDVSRLLPDTVFVGDVFNLNVMALESISRDATRQTIEWSYALPGATGWIPLSDAEAGSFEIPNPGTANRFTTLSLRAIVRSGRLWLDDLDANVYIFGEATRIAAPFIPVIAVTLPPDQVFTQRALHNLNALATVNPTDATHQNIEWTIRHQLVDQWGNTHWGSPIPIPGGLWTPSGYGDYRLYATIGRGLGDADYGMSNTDYVREIPIIVRPVAGGAIIPVTSLTLPPAINAATGSQINLSNLADIAPANATNREILWDDIMAWESNDFGTPIRLTHTNGVFNLPANITRLLIAGEIPDGTDWDNPFFFDPITIYVRPVGFVPVQTLNISLYTLVSNNISLGSSFDLNSATNVTRTMTPASPTNSAITWEFREANGISWTEISGGNWTPAANGWFEVRARIRSGHTPGLDFISNSLWFNVGMGAFVPVASVNFASDSQTVGLGGTINLLSPVPPNHVSPSDATSSIIQWTVTVVTRDVGRVTPARRIPMNVANNASTLTLNLPVTLYPWEALYLVELTATIAGGSGSGSNFTAGHIISIYPPVP